SLVVACVDVGLHYVPPNLQENGEGIVNSECSCRKPNKIVGCYEYVGLHYVPPNLQENSEGIVNSKDTLALNAIAPMFPALPKPQKT
ncbi:MAG: hypothetical protein SXA11_15095, partial [Cyanobacteriota bacterium]|nr:hypothetical protein [Cyanobacteriota bacterium]